MFTSTLPYTRGISDDDRVIHYVNALPGAGKTWTFDHKIALPHVKEKHNSLLVYAAPTARLLHEREQSLLDLGVTRKHLMVITSEDTSIPVAEQFRQAVAGTPDKKGLPDGSIILCTHECVARIPDNLKAKDRIVLVYDEARACLQDNYALHLPEDVYGYLTEPQEHLTENGKRVKVRLLTKLPVYEASNAEDSESVYIWRWTNHRIPLPTLQQLQDFLPRTNRQRGRAANILDFLKNVHSSSLDVYVSIERKAATAEYVVSNVFSPSRMFKGYAKVLILSAFFESSQMYQFLAKSNQIDNDPLDLEDITKGYIDRKRVTKLLRRLRNTYLTYVFDLDGRTLTKSEMQQAIVVESPVSKSMAKAVHAKWHELYPSKPEFYRTVYDSYVDRDARASRMSDEARDLPYRMMAALDDRFKLLGGVIPYMVHTAIRLQQSFMTKMKLPAESLPVGINPRYNSYNERELKIWDAEGLDQLNLQTKRYKKPVDGDIIMKLPIAAHGLNAYQALRSCAFLAAMKYSKREQTFLKRTIAEYNPTVDRTLDYALQLLWRCNVRMPSEDPAILIVTDRKLAEELQTRFYKIARHWLKSSTDVLPILDPRKLLKNYVSPTILRYTFDTTEGQKRSNENRKTSVKGKEAAELKRLYMASPHGPRYYQLSNQISYAKKNGKEFASLVRERDKVLSLAQWKVTKEGVAAYQSLNKKFDRVAAAREALQHLDATKLRGRNERLKILSVIKRECPELKADAKAWYTGDNFEHNWETAQDYGKRYNLGWLFDQRKKFPR